MGKRFAAKYQNKTLARIALGVGAFLLLSAFAQVATTLEFRSEVIGRLVIGLALLTYGIYLVRATELSPAAIARNKAKADGLKAEIERKIATLSAASGGAAVLAYRDLSATVKKTKPANIQATLDNLLETIGFDKSSIESHFIGAVPISGVWGNKKIEIYKDWVIAGNEAYDVDISTRAEVHVDGGIVFDKKNNQVDTRTATMQFVSTDWAKSFSIPPDSASAARTMASQLAAVIDALKPKGVTGADISTLVDTLLKNTGQPAAEKLQQLSDLRYQRLLSDDEFEAAKAKVLGI
jgi:hypothetical protein